MVCLGCPLVSPFDGEHRDTGPQVGDGPVKTLLGGGRGPLEPPPPPPHSQGGGAERGSKGHKLISLIQMSDNCGSKLLGGGGGGITGAGAHQGQTNCEGEKDIWWTARTARGGTGHLGRTEPQRGRLWTACGQRCVDSKNSQTTPATTSTSSTRQLLGVADTQTAHHATFSTAPTHQPLGSANAETTPARAPAAAADRKQRPDATCEGKNG